MNTIIWTVVLIIMVIAEFVTQQLVTIWFVVGSAVAIMASLTNMSFTAQFLIFVLVSIIALVLTRPFVKKFLHKEKVKTNADMVVGKIATVIEDINSVQGAGRVKINGLNWKASSDTEEIIKVGENVKVIRIEGVTLIVEK